eukprot:scaffold1733_cov257-Pinguiococcus_pyrenoidosus.AAC.7
MASAFQTLPPRWLAPGVCQSCATWINGKGPANAAEVENLSGHPPHLEDFKAAASLFKHPCQRSRP